MNKLIKFLFLFYILILKKPSFLCESDIRTVSENCGGTFSGYQYMIGSPNYPSIYPENQDCIYFLRGNRLALCDEKFNLQFLDFDLRPSENCEKDFLQIGERNIYCGSTEGTRTFKGENNFLKIRFHSGKGVGGKGFKILVTTLPCVNVQENSTNNNTHRDVEITTDRKTETSSKLFFQDNIYQKDHPLFPKVESVPDKTKVISNRNRFEVETLHPAYRPRVIFPSENDPFPSRGNPPPFLQESNKNFSTSQNTRKLGPSTYLFLPPSQNSKKFSPLENSQFSIIPNLTEFSLPIFSSIPFRSDHQDLKKSTFERQQSAGEFYDSSVNQFGVGIQEDNDCDKNQNFGVNKNTIKENGFPDRNFQTNSGTGILRQKERNEVGFTGSVGGSGSEIGHGVIPGIGSGSYPGFWPGNYPGNNPGIGSGNYPEIGSGSYPEIGSGSYPGIGSGNYPGNNPGIGSGNYPEIGSGSYPGIGSGNYPGIGSGNYPEIGSGSYPGIGSGNYPGNYPVINSGNYPWIATGINTGWRKPRSQCCNSFHPSQRSFLITSPGFPVLTFTPTPYECSYIINKYSGTVCRLRLNLKFFNLGFEDPYCTNGYLEIDGRRICGCKTGQSFIFSFGISPAKIVNVRYSGFPKSKFNGFLIEVIQENCRDYYPLIGNRKDSLRLNESELLGKGDKFIDSSKSINSHARSKREGYLYPKPSGHAILDVHSGGGGGGGGEGRGGGRSESLFFNSCQSRVFLDWILAAKEAYIRGARCPRSENVGQINSVIPSSGHWGDGFPENCQEIAAIEGVITSPFYNNYYPNNIRKCYRFHKSQGMCRLELSILDFDLESSLGCSKDYLLFSGQNKRYCGDSLIGTTTIFDLSRSNVAEIYFITDSSGSGRGFIAGFVQTLC